jgi:hypothetical protein
VHGERDDDRDGTASSMPSEPEIPPSAPGKHGGRRPGAGRKRTHGYALLRRAVTTLGTKRLDGRSKIAVAVRAWKNDIRQDLGGDLSRAQETLLEAAAQAWVILGSLDDWIARQPSLVTRKRQLVPVVMQRMQIAEGLARHLERLGLERRAKDVDLVDEIAALRRQQEAAGLDDGTEKGST